MPLQTLLTQLTARLAPSSETAALDVQVLLGHVLGRPRAWVLAHPEAEISPEQRDALESGARRLEAGEPLPYVIGHWEFFGLDFSLTPNPSPSGRGEFPPLPEGEGPGVRESAISSPPVLIPRPETEQLVERALAWLRMHPARRTACDVGAGSGCIAVTLAVHVPDLSVLATDISFPALQVARRNATRHGVAGRVQLLQADLLPPGQARFDLVCANLPYIPTQTLPSLAVYWHEPALALDGGPDGLGLIRRLLQAAPHRMAPGGLLLLEIEASQGEAAQTLASEYFPSASTAILPDLAGRDRLLQIRLPG